HGLMAHVVDLSERTVVPEAMIHRLPDTVTLEQGALVEPMAVAEHAVRRTHVRPGEAAVVFGAGPIGLGSLFALQAAGAEPVIVFETSPTRRALAEQLGATHVLDPTETIPALVIRELTDGEGADVAVDAAGVPATALGTLQALGSR